MALKKYFIALFSLWLLSSTVLAQSDLCPALIQNAVERTSDICTITGRNEICYGNIDVEVQARDDAPLDFSVPGDIVALRTIQSIESAPLNLENAEFGIALMRVQANVPGSLPGQNISFLLMGQMSVSDNSEAIEGASHMEAFLFNPGIGQSRCAGVNYDRLVIDSPDNLVVNLNINGVDVELGSTAVVIGEKEGFIDVLIVEGEGRVSANGGTQMVPAGMWSQVEIGGGDSGLEAVSVPEAPVPFPPNRIAGIPFNLLNAGQNIATGKPVMASNSLETDASENVVNGFATGSDNWNAGDQALPQWIEIDLEEETAINGLRLFTSQFPPQQRDRTVHNILIAGEDRRFERVHQFDQETRDDEWLEFTSQEPIFGVRYVRVESVLTPHFVSWGEVEVFAAPLAGCFVGSQNNVNLRSGPGTTFEVAGTLTTGENPTVIAQTVGVDNFTWWQLLSEAWVRSDVVSAHGDCSTVLLIEN